MERMTRRGHGRGAKRAAAAGAALAPVALALLALAGPAAAQARPDSLTMTCNQARQLVASRGALILGSGPHIYDRIVANQSFCPWPQHVERTFVPTRDTRNCFVGYVCRDGRPEWPWFDD